MLERIETAADHLPFIPRLKYFFASTTTSLSAVDKSPLPLPEEATGKVIICLRVISILDMFMFVCCDVRISLVIQFSISERFVSLNLLIIDKLSFGRHFENVAGC